MPALIAVDSVSSVALMSAARAALASIDRRKRSVISHWDASGLFEELGVADEAVELDDPIGERGRRHHLAVHERILRYVKQRNGYVV